MKRDIELIREILLAIEADKPGSYTRTNEPKYNHHLHLMAAQGLLNGKEVNEGQWRIVGLSWDGYELLEFIRDEIRWKGIKRVLNDLNCYSFEIVERVAIQQMKLHNVAI